MSKAARIASIGGRRLSVERTHHITHRGYIPPSRRARSGVQSLIAGALRANLERSLLGSFARTSISIVQRGVAACCNDRLALLSRPRNSCVLGFSPSDVEHTSCKHRVASQLARPNEANRRNDVRTDRAPSRRVGRVAPLVVRSLVTQISRSSSNPARNDWLRVVMRSRIHAWSSRSRCARRDRVGDCV